MKLYKNPPRDQWDDLLKRPLMDLSEIEQPVRDILSKVKTGGDKAILELTARFDGVGLGSLLATEEEVKAAAAQVDDELKEAIDLARDNIIRFHASQEVIPKVVETSYGVKCWQKHLPIERVGLYVPGGTAPLFSTVLMLALPAEVAGCSEVVLCTPPAKDGSIHPAILYSAQVAGVKKIVKAGGAQAIAAMAYGTDSVPEVYKIFGPGNQWVTMAKMIVAAEGIAIDMPAGPSEVMVVADDTAKPEFVAADLLSQAEHGTDSQAILVSHSEELAIRSMEEVERQLKDLPRREMAAKTLENSRVIVLDKMEDIIGMMNIYAPEHLILSVKEPFKLSQKVVNAGSVFLGNYAPESAGDYASGTNHTLPTNGYAKMYSGANLHSFMKSITFQEITPDGIKAIGPAIERMAQEELLDAHKNAVSVRLRGLE